MDIVSTILNAAKMAKVSGVLLVGICSHESNNFTMTYSAYDNGSPSFGICQVKEDSARQLGFTGRAEELMDIKTNAHYAALYLRYQQNRYGDDWCRQTASYNSGSYIEGRNPGYPKNLNYVRLVQKKLPEDFKDKLSCGNRRY
jgi:soluble lytic murein transglycosylase-like protein